MLRGVSSVFDCLTEEEREIYYKYKSKSKLDEKQIAKEELLKSVNDYSGVREILKRLLFNKEDEPIISKLIAGFENECVRLSESLVYDEKNRKTIY